MDSNSVTRSGGITVIQDRGSDVDSSLSYHLAFSPSISDTDNLIEYSGAVSAAGDTSTEIVAAAFNYNTN